MRKPRATWNGAFHHVMNRGIDGLPILNSEDLKGKFHSFISRFSKKFLIKVFAYCILDNHYHLILQNTSGMLSPFMQSLNGSYGTYYRKITQSKGYVFQGRFKSTLIESDSYLINAIAYTLNNPVRSKLVSDPLHYSWSSANSYFSTQKITFIDSKYVENLFQSKKNLHSILGRDIEVSQGLSQTPLGEIYGSEKISFLISNDMEKFFKSLNLGNESGFQSINKTIRIFEHMYGIEVNNIHKNKKNGKKLQRKLLKMLRDKSMLKYSEISKLSYFRDVKVSTLRNMYYIAKSE